MTTSHRPGRSGRSSTSIKGRSPVSSIFTRRVQRISTQCNQSEGIRHESDTETGMRKQNSVGHPSCTRRAVPKKEIKFIGAKTRKTLLYESLSTRARELRAKLDHFEQRKRGQHERHYAT